jgi:maltose alpha-D-glucosyltransferase/alpha-amylase
VREDFRQGLLALIRQNASLAVTTSRSGHTDDFVLTHPVTGPDARAADIAADAEGQLGHLPAEPAPISAQPGEAATPAKLDAETTHAAASQNLQPRESPFSGDETLDSAHLMARASKALASVAPTPALPSRVGSAEQSNTSILYGGQLILKMFRRLQPGENPDVEIGRFLTETAHFPRIAPFLGEISLLAGGGEKTTVAMLQGLVANEGDGWQWFEEQLSTFFAAIAHQSKPGALPTASFTDEREAPREAAQHAGPALRAAALLGRRTAEMHLALATATSDSLFAAEPFAAEDLERDARRIDAQITSTLEALRMKLSTLKDSIADDAALLLSRRIDLFARANAITSQTAAGQRIRIHGDYHLGQTLRTRTASAGATADSAEADGDFVLLDFEGEPARTLAERRQKQSPLKDVAGMLRSLSYAAYSGLYRYFAENPDVEHSAACGAITAWAVQWQNSVSSAFLKSYRETVSANPALLPSAQQSQALLGAYLLEKALYELLYELNNRPAWLRIPLAGILAL